MFKEFDIFTKGKTPFTINGEVDFSDLERTAVNLKMHAENYELLNAPRTKRAMVYGKMYVDFNATLRGPVEELVMRGNICLLYTSQVPLFELFDYHLPLHFQTARVKVEGQIGLPENQRT